MRRKEGRTTRLVEFFGCWGGMIVAMPMFYTAEHSMRIWNTKYGKLPFDQLLAVGLTGTVLQAGWLIAIVLSPAIYACHLAWLFKKEVQKDNSQVQIARAVRICNVHPCVAKTLRVETTTWFGGLKSLLYKYIKL